MKKIIKSITMFLFVTITVIGQTVPQAMNYQAILRGSAGNPLVNVNACLRFSIDSGGSTGPILYRERQQVTTNSFGLFTVKLGMGTIVNGVFANIPWSLGNQYLQVEMDTSCSNSWTDMGTSQLLSVPYALSAGNNAVGPAGATGATGLTGATGPTGATGSSIIATSTSSATINITNTIVNYLNGTVTITVPSAGSIVVEANVQVGIYHTANIEDDLYLIIGATPTDAGSYYDAVYWTTPASFPNFSGISQTFTVRRTFTVSNAGTYTYYLNGVVNAGGTGDFFNWCAMVAIFY